jgi:SNF2 family DNA or RNA helicase
MGCGKTVTALVAAKAYNLPVIVVCPASLLINWQREAEMVGVEIAVYSWAKVPKAPESDFVLICDEFHYCQSITAQRTKAMLALAKSDHCRGLYGLSGTPIKNGRPANLYPLLLAVKHPVAEDRREYERRYCNAHETRWTRWDISGASNLDELHKLTRDAILRRLKKDVLDLPEKTRVLRGVELSAGAKKVYKEKFDALRKEYREKFLGDNAKDENIQGPAEALVMINYLRLAGSIAKTETAIELAQDVIEEGGQVVLFVAFLESWAA